MLKNTRTKQYRETLVTLKNPMFGLLTYSMKLLVDRIAYNEREI